jgi:redox-sensitive bicupin YhaK (pirin superfamily)
VGRTAREIARRYAHGMSWQLPEEPFSDRGPDDAVETVIVPRTRDLGDGFEVRRALPSRRRQMVGPFIFFDRMGPADLAPGRGLDVRPHPHIGLATVTYLFEGELLHRDSLGTVQRIRPGAVNWMTAGRGIVHSERTPPDVRAAGGRLSGIQLWVALPARLEEAAPSFVHAPAEALPELEAEGLRVRLVVGTTFGMRAPVDAPSPAFYADAWLERGARLPMPAEHEERALFVVEGEVAIGGASFTVGQLAVLRPRAPVLVEARAPSRAMLLGGAPLDGPRHVWWNFVSSSRERLEQAIADWAEGRFAPVPGETERIPLPDAPRVARYP